MLKTILFTDDSIFMFEEIKYILKDSDYTIIRHCRDGEEAIEAYAELQPDIVIMDIILPGIDGLETSKAILEKWPDAHIVILSSLAYDETIENASRTGACGFLFKPMDKETVFQCLDQIQIPGK